MPVIKKAMNCSQFITFLEAQQSVSVTPLSAVALTNVLCKMNLQYNITLFLSISAAGVYEVLGIYEHLGIFPRF